MIAETLAETPSAPTIDGPALRFIRRAREVRQADVARRMGISRTRLQTIEAAPRVTDRLRARYMAALDELSGRR